VSFTTVVSVTGRHVGLLLPTLNTIVAVRGMGEPEQRFNWLPSPATCSYPYWIQCTQNVTGSCERKQSRTRTPLLGERKWGCLGQWPPALSVRYLVVVESETNGTVDQARLGLAACVWRAQKLRLELLNSTRVYSARPQQHPAALRFTSARGRGAHYKAPAINY
jgi:hypothetical protein